MKFMSATRRAH